MTIAFCLYKYFPYGGLQRDFLRIAHTVAARGHHVQVLTQQWQGERPSDLEIILVPVTARTNHGKNEQYYQWVQSYLSQHPVDRVVGFNKMPGLDVYYAADVCYAEKVAREKGFFYKLTSRYKHYAAFEKATFQQGAHTELLMLTNKQIGDFKHHYHTEDRRFHILPPGIYPDRKYSQQPENSRQIVREKNGIGLDQFLLLQVGSDFKRKGVPRTLLAVASLPEAIRQRMRLMVVGQDKADRYQAQARQLGIEKQVQFFSGRDDISALMSAADLLLHPAVQEAAGIVLLEAIVAGLPVLTTEVCGYAHYINAAQCGVVIPEPFAQEVLNDSLCDALEKGEQRSEWASHARHFADTEDLYSLADKAADIILGFEND
ncbi:glycosyltransferase family 4 protein [Citrobacter koseri]|uniref:glycosyltransferase family 4 protein n=1 Tax=Citrobacter koseri TaxID=545 RepID=UPI0023B1B312|nr:glycosyltransferase family 4 protein [Citrobacter koseri]EKU0541293.1 glycosyltransferase family 4 protein [Citrobacter koseri]EKU8896187.1 glycosyltransferase family 4 protein [Citrobacter koseri]MDT7453162.1 glycosyltransferase family 4 protein [Citrobacter koseri]HEM6798193.1 glycosyltransferase family 4 protein [Citrobacter koseri]HEM6829559.1 glycosyltransferase family 4 protein [Citrobacter koseri]